MSSKELSMIVGALISGAAAFTPGFKNWFGALPPDWKRLIMAGTMLAVAIGAYALGCYGIGPITCDKPGAIALVETFLLGLAANQATYDVLPRFEAPPSATAGAAKASA